MYPPMRNDAAIATHFLAQENRNVLSGKFRKVCNKDHRDEEHLFEFQDEMYFVANGSWMRNALTI